MEGGKGEKERTALCCYVSTAIRTRQRKKALEPPIFVALAIMGGQVYQNLFATNQILWIGDLPKVHRSRSIPDLNGTEKFEPGWT